MGWAAEIGGLTRALGALLPVLLAVALLTRLPAPRREAERAATDTGADVAAGAR